MFKNPFAGFDFGSPFERKRSRNLFGVHTTPREFKHGARDIPFGMGAQSLYVDGTNGHDSNDGESWKTAKATIQEAVDTADSWTQMFIKAGTYAEDVTIPSSKRNLHLLGEIRDSTIIRPGNGSPALDCLADNCQFTSLYFDANHTSPIYSFRANADINQVMDCRIGSADPNGQSIALVGDDCKLLHSIFDTDIQSCISVSGNRVEIRKCRVITALSVGNATGMFIEGDENNISENIVSGFNHAYGKGISVPSGGSYNTIFHNNLIDNTKHLYDSGSPDSSYFENYYSNHTNIDNGFGIATEPYAFTGGTDLRPVVCLNGWNSVSILRSLLRKKTAAQTTQAATNANGTAWVDLKTLTPTTSDIELYQVKMTTAGSWAGTAKYRIIVGSTKVYPFPADKSITSGTLESFIFPINIQINETAKIQFRSDNAGDGAGDTVTLNQLDYATVL